MSAILRTALALLLLAAPAAAGERGFTLRADPSLVASGLMDFILPRFSLKTGVQVTLTEDAADAVLGPGGKRAAISGPDSIHRITAEGEHASRFADWLLSDIGQRTVADFPPYSGAATGEAATDDAGFEGNARLGEELALTHCGRCHVVSEANRMSGIGSTPSFAALRGFADWDTRFAGFFTLNPHPSFTQIAGVTPPFPPERPAHIVPVELTMDQLDAILAYVTVLEPADLGAPVQVQ
ncbi:hypothetical protein DDZ14_09265 [Maritimibacter sp. 55A14]|uniref:c-type cytochrome n=1 Tax=Maritimibacter sp. 55A14 TaxID=2174844 RepID=UPI000D61B1EC|nr:cytochrome c [Maritimibacter sp. 55A14]PWE32576.1 hypothetical protein DDZ14_09265 [Maritimibacter sp. 55A14]